jgi:hypothetical protein
VRRGQRFDLLTAVLPDRPGRAGAAPDDADEADNPVRRGRGGGAERGAAGQAAGARLLRTARVRADATVIGANVAYPTDCGLLAKAVGKLVRAARRVQAAGGAAATVMRDRRRAAGRRVRQVAGSRRRMLISSGVGWSGRDARNLAAMRTRRSLPAMSAVDGWALLAYQGRGPGVLPRRPGRVRRWRTSRWQSPGRRAGTGRCDGAAPSWNHDAAQTFLPRRWNKVSSITTTTDCPTGTSSAATSLAATRPGRQGSTGRGRKTSAPGRAATAATGQSPRRKTTARFSAANLLNRTIFLRLTQTSLFFQ